MRKPCPPNPSRDGMSLTDQTTLRVVLYEGAGSEPLTSDARFATMSTLLQKGFAVTRANGQGTPVSNRTNSLLVLGQFANGQAPALEDQSGQVRIESRNLTGLSQDAVAQVVESVRVLVSGASSSLRPVWSIRRRLAAIRFGSVCR